MSARYVQTGAIIDDTVPYRKRRDNIYGMRSSSYPGINFQVEVPPEVCEPLERAMEQGRYASGDNNLHVPMPCAVLGAQHKRRGSIRRGWYEVGLLAPPGISGDRESPNYSRWLLSKLFVTDIEVVRPIEDGEDGSLLGHVGRSFQLDPGQELFLPAGTLASAEVDDLRGVRFQGRLAWQERRHAPYGETRPVVYLKPNRVPINSMREWWIFDQNRRAVDGVRSLRGQQRWWDLNLETPFVPPEDVL